jgi:hypothetical protein
MTENLSPVVKELFEQAVRQEVLHREQEAAKLGDKRQQILADYLTVAYEKGAAFTTVLLGAGYVGLFAIWGWVAPYLHEWQILTAALLIGSSLLIFMGWQIFGMLNAAILNLRLAKTIDASKDFDAQMVAYQLAGKKFRVKLAILMPWVLGSCLSTGLAGALLLLGSAAYRLITTGYFPHLN